MNAETLKADKLNWCGSRDTISGSEPCGVAASKLLLPRPLLNLLRKYGWQSIGAMGAEDVALFETQLNSGRQNVEIQFS
jgi:hypothetical protein